MGLRSLRAQKRQIQHNLRSVRRGDIDEKLLKVFQDSKDVNSNEQRESDK